MSATWFDLTAKVAVVTGGSKGLGRTIAGALARAGAHVAITSRTQADLDQVAAELGQHGRQVLSVCSDVTDEDSIRAMVQQVIDRFGQIDILVNNAGVEGIKAVTEMSAEYWDRVLQVNLRGPMLCCKHVGPHMIRRQRGKVINVASVLASRVARYVGAYAASKAALLGFTRALALELAPEKITVNGLSPGPVATEMNIPLIQNPELNQQFISRIPLGRWGKVEEVGQLAVYLCSEEASFITGTDVLIDGGWTAQ